MRKALGLVRGGFDLTDRLNEYPISRAKLIGLIDEALRVGPGQEWTSVSSLVGRLHHLGQAVRS